MRLKDIARHLPEAVCKVDLMSRQFWFEFKVVPLRLLMTGSPRPIPPPPN